MKLAIVLLVIGIFCIAGVSAMTIDYYYHPQCGHCQQITPYINEIVGKYYSITFNILDTSKGSYNIQGTPTLIIHTKDDREIELVGGYEIPTYTECELNEMSTLECPTYSGNYNEDTQSWFIR